MANLINLQKLNGYTRSVQAIFPHPEKVGAQIPVQMKVRFNVISSDRFDQLFGEIDEDTNRPKHSQEEIFNEIVDWIDPEAFEGVEDKHEAKEMASTNLTIQNACIQEYSKTVGGLGRKNSRK